MFLSCETRPAQKTGTGIFDTLFNSLVFLIFDTIVQGIFDIMTELWAYLIFISLVTTSHNFGTESQHYGTDCICKNVGRNDKYFEIQG